MVSGAGVSMVMRIAFGKLTRWLEKFSTNIAKCFISIGFAIPFAAAVRYRFNSSGRGSTEMSPRALIITAKKHCVLCGIVQLRDTLISRALLDSALSVRRSGSGA